MNKIIGIVLIVLAFVLWGVIFIVPFMPGSAAFKGLVFGAVLIVAEIFFWVGSAMVGAEYLNKFMNRKKQSAAGSQ